ncbi:tRNA pseudouridine synthase A [Helicobacter didelphidarum]|nr:tRNA pseudouridine synthase A [Helicobacter didelphidarum]
MNVVCIIAYDGSKFCGFSKQKKDSIKIRYLETKIQDDTSMGLPYTTKLKMFSQENELLSVADFFESALKRIGINTHIIASGRTDKGVHATYQVINFHTDLTLQQMPLEKMKNLLNQKLSPSVLVRKIFLESNSFHARFSAKVRTYRYIFTQEDILPFFNPYIAKVQYGNPILIQQALDSFLGIHDFSLFKKNGSETKNFVREIYKATLLEKKLYNIPCCIIHISANGFLRSQVRMMIQACLYVSLAKISLADLQCQIDNNMLLTDKSCVRELAPQGGLYLCRVVY